VVATQIFLILTPILGEMIQFDCHIFFKWVEPTNQSWLVKYDSIWPDEVLMKVLSKCPIFGHLNGSTGVTDLQRYCLISIEILVDWG